MKLTNKELLEKPPMTSFHACENEGANCISFMDALSGKKGHVCWCGCHGWNYADAARAAAEGESNGG